jgi:hypothetical protein
MTDLVKRLRNETVPGKEMLCLEAAVEIEWLRKALEANNPPRNWEQSAPDKYGNRETIRARDKDERKP